MVQTIEALNAPKTLINAFVRNCNAANGFAAFVSGEYDIPQDNIDSIIESINNAEDMVRTIYSSTQSYKNMLNNDSIRTAIMKCSGVENAAAEAALKAALVDVLGI